MSKLLKMQQLEDEEELAYNAATQDHDPSKQCLNLLSSLLLNMDLLSSLRTREFAFFIYFEEL